MSKLFPFLVFFYLDSMKGYTTAHVTLDASYPWDGSWEASDPG
ncbi:hypothetical protein DAI22_05g107300 [Oryza sativa Japonica Group]|nr:hypothetical protein DAI22_05g107300 [Oryza sativa Japonica Group]